MGAPIGPLPHEATHTTGQADPFLSTDVLEAIVKRLQESGGPTTLLLGAVADTQLLQRSGTSIVGAAASGVGAVLNTVVGGRLTLSSTQPVSTTDLTAVGTLYYLPLIGNQIALWNGSAWIYSTIPNTGVSVAIPNTTVGTPVDIFAQDGAGTVSLVTAANWTNASVRSTPLALADGVLVKSSAALDKKLRYLGTYVPTAANQTEDSAANRYLWNYYNRVERRLQGVDTTAFWSYTLAAWRPANNNTTPGVGRVQLVIGWDETPVEILVFTQSVSSGSIKCSGGIGIDSTSVNSADAFGNQVDTLYRQSVARYCGIPGVGQHYFQRLEVSQASGLTTWYGQSLGTPATDYQTGIFARFTA